MGRCKKRTKFYTSRIRGDWAWKRSNKSNNSSKKKTNLTQQELSEKSGIIQPSIAKIENFARTPKYTTLIKMLYAMGYTLKVVPIKNKVKDKNSEEKIK